MGRIPESNEEHPLEAGIHRQLFLALHIIGIVVRFSLLAAGSEKDSNKFGGTETRLQFLEARF